MWKHELHQPCAQSGLPVLLALSRCQVWGISPSPGGETDSECILSG